MTRQFHTYLRPEGQTERDVQISALEAFALQIGCPQRPLAIGGSRAQIQHWIDTPSRPTRLADREMGAVMLRSLADGDVLLVPSLADLADLPSDFDATLKTFIVKNVALHVIELPGLGAGTLQPLARALATAFSALEQARSSLQAELAEVQANAEQRLAVAMQAGLEQLARNWGLPASLKANLPEVGSVREPLNGNGHGGHLGEAIAAARKKRGMDQKALATALGVSQPTISRLEANGTGDCLNAALQFLFSDQGGTHATAS
jgi:DNA-binding XRE family transcriptional regulator/DNA invertase Pin-like site-specific DNA recombinase